MENVVEFAWLALELVGLVLLLLGLLVLVMLVVKVSATGERWLALQQSKVQARLAELDSHSLVLGFGQSPIGQATHRYLQQAQGAVDDADDPIIQAALKLPLIRQAHKKGLLTGEELSAKLSETIEKAIWATDGVPNVRVAPANDSEGVG